MIVFQKIRWKNFLSTGNSFTEVVIDESPSHLIIGSNGAGKSTMLDAICFGLFNKPFRKINKPQLVNTINERECVVEIEFSVGSVQYKVVRGIKPNVFEIYRNDSLIDQDAANKDYQKYLEQSILKFNFKSFTQVVILGSSTFVPFMQLPAAHRREVIEDLLDIQVFSRMNALLKDRVKDTKESIKECEHKFTLAEQQVNMQRKTIDNMEKMSSEWIVSLQKKFSENEDRFLEINKQKKEFQDQIDTLTSNVADMQSVQDKHDQMRDMRAKIQQNLTKAKKEIDFYTTNSKCPTCSQDLSESHKQESLDKCRTKRDKFDAGLTDITTKINDIYFHLKLLREYQDQITGHQHSINTLSGEHERLLKENAKIINQVNKETPDIDLEKDKLQAFREAFDETQKDCAAINQEMTDLKVVSTLLKDGGIKSKIISKFIPVINQKINKYLQSMDFAVNFTLDEEFGEVIKSRFRDVFSYASFSEGEKQKIDLALLFCWRDIAKMKNSASTNLLILDEVFDSSLDETATDELMKILRGLDKNTNLFVISHKGEVLLDKFHTTLRFEKVNDFSKVTVEEAS